MCWRDGFRVGLARGGILVHRYEITGGRRELVAFDEAGGLVLVDREQGSEDGGLLVDSGVVWGEAVEAFVAEYVRIAERTDAVPCAREGFAIFVARALE